MPVHIDKRLREINLASWSGRPGADYRDIVFLRHGFSSNAASPGPGVGAGAPLLRLFIIADKSAVAAPSSSWDKATSDCSNRVSP